MEIPGDEVVRPLVLPILTDSNSLSYTAQYLATRVQEAWNKSGLCFLPICMDDGEAVTWHLPIEEDGTIFHCPKCQRKWLKHEEWELQQESMRTP